MLSDLPHHLAVILALSHKVAAGYQIGTSEFSRHEKTPYGCSDSLIGDGSSKGRHNIISDTGGAFAQQFLLAMCGCLASASFRNRCSILSELRSLRGHLEVAVQPCT